MIIGTVIGQIHSTISHPFYGARTLLVVEKDLPGEPRAGEYIVAVDTVGAGIGQVVLILDEGNGARQVLDAPGAPVRSVVVGIVDAVSLH